MPFAFWAPGVLSETRARSLHGSLDQEGVLEFGLIGRGMHFIFLLNDGRPVTTTRVLRIHVDRPGVVLTASSPSIH